MMNKTWRWKMAQAAEIRWWQGYLKKKDKKSYLAWKTEYWEGFLKQCNLKLPLKASCLDAGCGPAGIFTILKEQTVEAVDPLLDAYEKKLAHFDMADYPKVNFYTETLECFEPKKKYDYVFCLNAINHVNDLEKSIRKLFEWTKEGGKLLISIDVHNYKIFKYLFRLIPGDILHPHQYDLKEYSTKFKSVGGKIENIVCIKKAFFFNYHAVVLQKIG